MSQNVSRRDVLRSAGAAGAAVAGAGALAACGSSSTTSASSAASAAGSAASAAATKAATAASSAGVGTTVAKADVPVGGGKIVGKSVVTQPTAGQFKAFSAVCTHEGCLVSSVENSQILCFCHHSAFDAATGAPVSGPARSPLPPKSVTASGDNLVVT